MADLADVTALKQSVEKLQRESDRASGILEAALKLLKEQFGCADLEEAEALCKELKEAEAKARAAFSKALQEFEDEWSATLTESNDES